MTEEVPRLHEIERDSPFWAEFRALRLKYLLEDHPEFQPHKSRLFPVFKGNRDYENMLINGEPIPRLLYLDTVMTDGVPIIGGASGAAKWFGFEGNKRKMPRSHQLVTLEEILEKLQ